MINVYLDYTKAREFIIDREKFLEENSMSKDSYKMMTNTPIIICVEGSYINVNDLLSIVEPRYKMIVSRFLMELKFPKNEDKRPCLSLKWRR